MKPVARSEILDYLTYEDERPRIRPEIMAQKALRRISVGEYLTFLFENHDTVWYQIQEMIRAERLVREADIQHEIETYNELLGAEGELGCTLMIEIDDPRERDDKLRRWLELPTKVYVRLADGRKVYADFDSRQVGTDRLSSVQYLKFKVGREVPVAVGCDLAEIQGETHLTAEQRKALAVDLGLEEVSRSAAVK